MTDAMPSGGYEWLDPDSFLISSDTNGGTCYIVEVDVEYNQNLHDLHSELPFLVEKLELDGNEKLCATLYSKKNYVSSLRNIQQAIRHGLKVTKIHRVLKMNQSNWLQPYIALNNTIRRKATDPTRKDLAKLMNNSVSLPLLYSLKLTQNTQNSRSTI